MPSRLALWAVAVAALGSPAHAGQTNVAVAANFTDAAKEIAEAFRQKTGDQAVLSFGSTGQLYAQISQGAPFDVFLAADDQRPQKAIDDGLAVPGSAFTYATGKIVLWSRDPQLVQGAGTLESGKFEKIAIANPAGAPYGAAAVQTMRALGVYDRLEAKLVQGNNVAQTYQFVDTGNAELGFVALSQVANSTEDSRWVVPGDLYDVIRQDAVLLETGADSEAAKAFVEFLKGPQAARIMDRYGYGTGVS